MSSPDTTSDAGDSPQHGFRGDRGAPPPVVTLPAGLAVAVSREAGARGGTIARRIARKLGWQVYNQELLEYIAQEGTFRENLFANLPASASHWAEERVSQLSAERKMSHEPAVLNLVKTILAVSAPGEVVLLGRGAGCVLPRESTLNVRFVAPVSDRVAYMSQWLRLTLDDAAEQVRLRDASRATFIQKHFHRQPGDIYQYDLLLNSSLLGEDLCVELVVQAARARQTARTAGQSASPAKERE
jgi:cytidylate kinase